MSANYITGGDVVGPAGATANAVPRYSGTTGKLLRDSGVVVNDSGQVGIGTATPAGMLSVLATATSTVGVTIRAASGQTADLFQIRNNASSVLAEFDAAGNLAVGTATASAMVHAAARVASSIPLIAQAAASQTGNLTEWRNSSGTTLLSVGPGGVFTVPEEGTIAILGQSYPLARFGTGSSDQGYVALGRKAGGPATGLNYVAIGSAALESQTGNNNTAVGAAAGRAVTSGGNNVFVGRGAGATVGTGSSNTLIGFGADVSAGTIASAIAIGNQSRATAANQCVIGSTITAVFVGLGVTSTSTSKGTVSINATGGDAATTDNMGQGLDLNGGAATGAGVGGSVRIRTSTPTTSGTAIQSLATVIQADPGSRLGFFNATPIARPATGGAAATVVANSGTAINDASTFDGYTLPQVVRALRNLGLLG